MASYRYELFGHQLSGNLYVEPYWVTLLPEAEPYVTLQHPGIKFLHLLAGIVRIQLGEQSGGLRVRQGQLGDRRRIEVHVQEGLPAIGQQSRTLFVGDEHR